MPTYSTRVLTAADNRLLAKLRTQPRYSALVERLSPTPPEPEPPSKSKGKGE